MACSGESIQIVKTLMERSGSARWPPRGRRQFWRPPMARCSLIGLTLKSSPLLSCRARWSLSEPLVRRQAQLPGKDDLDEDAIPARSRPRPIAPRRGRGAAEIEGSSQVVEKPGK